MTQEASVTTKIMTAPIEGRTPSVDRKRGDRGLRRRDFAASVLLHALVIAALVAWWQPIQPPKPPRPIVAMLVEGPGAAGAASGGGGKAQIPTGAPAAFSGSPASAAATPPSPSEAPPAAPQPEFPKVPPVPAQVVVPTPHATTLPPPVAEKSRIAALAPPPLPSRKPPPPRPRPRPKPVAAPAPRPRQDATPAPTPATTTPPTPLSTPSPVATAAPATAPAASGAQVASGAAAPGPLVGPGAGAGSGQGNEGRGHGAIGNGRIDGPGDDYLDALRRWLARYKHYPKDALDKKKEGTVVVGFVLKHDGTVLSAWIERSSGVPSLDDAALAMLHAASPVPPVPAHYKGAKLTITMPVDYSIGLFDRVFR